MRRLAPLLCCLALLMGPAAVEAGPAHDAAAEAVLAAIKAEDTAALARLAARDDPDPWRVADMLCLQGEFDAAAAFAAAAPRPDVRTLPAHVESRRANPVPPDRVARYRRAVAAFQQGAPAQALEIIGTDHEVGEHPIRVSAMILRYFALRRLNRTAEADALEIATAAVTEKMGWLSRATTIWVDVTRQATRRFDYKGVKQAAEARIRVARLRENDADLGRALSSRASANTSLARLAEARRDLEQAIPLLQAPSDASALATAWVRRAAIESKAGDHPASLKHLAVAREIAEKSGDPAVHAMCLARTADSHAGTGEYGRAIEYAGQAVALLRQLRMIQQLPAPLANIMRSHRERGDLPKALAAQQELTAVCRQLGHLPWIANALVDAAILQNDLGEFERARPMYVEALAITRKLGDRARQGHALKGLAYTAMRRGKFTEALRHAEEARALFQGVHNPAFLANLNRELGTIHMEIGNREAAVAAFQRADTIYESLGSRAHRADNLRSWAQAEFADDLGKARELYERSLVIYTDLDHEEGIAAARLGLATAAIQEGDPARGEAALREALERGRSRGIESPSPALTGLLSHTVGMQGRYEEALKLATAAVESATKRDERHMELWSRGWQVNALAGMKRFAEATALADTQLEAVGRLALGLSDQEATALRSKLQDFYDFAMNAAIGGNDVPAFVRYLESSRAGALLAGLGGRSRVREMTVPAALRDAEAAASARVRVARHELGRQRKLGKRKAVRAARDDLEKAEQALTELVDRIQREVKASAGLVYLGTSDLPTIQAELKAGDALVMYRLANEHSWAVVVTPSTARAVQLGTTAEVNEVAALSLASAESSWTEPTTKLAKRVIAPLTLGKDVTRVLISPDGSLTDVPFALLLPGRDIALISSGTTLAYLRGETSARGDQVLALGDPAYGVTTASAPPRARTRSWDLVPLPATRKEVNAIGDTILLGKDASETKLRATLPSQPRWRSVHLACHGLIDADRPSLSALALTADDENDGFLTCLDLFGLEIRADLAVLSACETGQGRVYSAEGVYGLMRAFMLAGTPRVFCSLWKVDDEATRALMLKFYELWNPDEGPGLGAAAALRKAQEHVRAQDKWKHPYYWAAWVLHGLPE